MTGISGAFSVLLLAEHPHLVGAIAEMRWREWGQEPGREDLSWWVDVTASEAGRRGLPVTWAAVDEVGGATGDPAVGLYRRCGWRETERLPPAWGDQLTILTRML